MTYLSFPVYITVLIVGSIIGAILLGKGGPKQMNRVAIISAILVISTIAIRAAMDSNYTLWAILAVATIGSAILYMIRSDRPKP